MSFRYRERTVVDGEAIDPHDWRENINSLVGELNGKLDRDNIPERSIESRMVVQGTFNQVKQSTDSTIRDYKDDNGDALKTVYDVHEVNYDFEEDGILTVHIGGTYSIPNHNLISSRADDVLVQISCTVNGVTISNVRNLTEHLQHTGFYAVGTYPVIAGNASIKIRARQEAKAATIGDLFLQFKQTSITTVYKRR
jgi:hypothetical protein